MASDDAYPDDPPRWVEKRKQFLSSRGSQGVGLREKVAEAVAWSELGYSSSGIAGKMGVVDETAEKYLDTASESYPGILARTVFDIDGDPNAGVDDLPPGPSERECPVCLNDALLTPSAADSVFSTSGWGATNMLEDADLVCSVCHSVRIAGEWRRMQKMHKRAWALAEAGSKTADEYKEVISGGITPDKGQVVKDRGVEDADGW